MQSRNEMTYKLPFGLRALKDVSVSQIVNGLSLADCCASDTQWRPAKSDIDPVFLDNMTLMLNNRLYLKLKREETDRKKLEKWIREEQVRRYVKLEKEKMETDKEDMRLQQLLQNELETARLAQVIHIHQ